MRNNWLFFMDFDGTFPFILPVKPLVSHSFGGHLFSQISSVIDDSLYQSRYLPSPGSIAFQGAFNCISKFAGSMLFWLSGGSSSSMTKKITQNLPASEPGSCKTSSQPSSHNLSRFHFSSQSKRQSATQVVFGKLSSLTVKDLFREAESLQSLPLLSLAAALVPPFNVSSELLADPLENNVVQVHGCMNQRPCKVEHRGCAGNSFPDMNWTRHAVEPKTGIEFPMVLGNMLSGPKNSSLNSEVLVGTGSRTMKIIKIKSLKIFAFGIYVHPYSVCEKLGPKYASTPVDKLNKHDDFYQDLLREDINMTVRLVINCNGVKINAVKNAFEKSLRARLVKTNPETDYHCLSTFSSCFTRDIPLPVGTTIDFRRTADGQLITEIGGNLIGAVRSKDLCRAFFDMYIGDIPVSEQTKEEVGKNVASMMKRC